MTRSLFVGKVEFEVPELYFTFEKKLFFVPKICI
jgi:hypothetical protein